MWCSCGPKYLDVSIVLLHVPIPNLLQIFESPERDSVWEETEDGLMQGSKEVIIDVIKIFFLFGFP
jgi:hypothetical protein